MSRQFIGKKADREEHNLKTMLTVFTIGLDRSTHREIIQSISIGKILINFQKVVQINKIQIQLFRKRNTKKQCHSTFLGYF